ncbi:MAG TPA: PqiC family protein [Myxococcota bacterium]|nr:PqiC family protein [Myxococcota bacterium]
MRVARSGVRVVMLLLAAGTAGCASRGLRVQEYILTSTPGDTAAPVPSASVDSVIGFGPIDVPSYLRRPEIVSRGPGARLQTRASERWGEDLEAGFRRALAGDLVEHLLPSARVILQPFPSASQPSYAVAIQIQRFEPVMDEGVVELDALWVLTRGAQPPLAATALRLESIREPVTDTTTEARVTAMSRAVEQLAARIATVVREALAQRSAAP